MANNTLDDLRTHLFLTLDELRDPVKKLDVGRARAVSEVAGQIIDSARVEVEFMKVTGIKHGSAFLEDGIAERSQAKLSKPKAAALASEENL